MSWLQTFLVGFTKIFVRITALLVQNEMTECIIFCFFNNFNIGSGMAKASTACGSLNSNIQPLSLESLSSLSSTAKLQVVWDFVSTLMASKALYKKKVSDIPSLFNRCSEWAGLDLKAGNSSAIRFQSWVSDGSGSLEKASNTQWTSHRQTESYCQTLLYVVSVSSTFHAKHYM